MLEPPPQQDYWIFAPGSAAESRRWPVERFASLAEMIFQKTGWKGLIVGGAAETEAGRILGELPGMLDCTAYGPVNTYAKLFRHARFSVANDSGLAHVASLCGSRVFITWGAGDARRTAPIGPGQASLTFNPVECWPCERNICYKEGADRLLCLRGIQPEQVWKEIESGLGRTRKDNADSCSR